MEPNKLDNEFRNKLNQREINPSEHAWDRLDAMLNEAENKKPVPVRRLHWLFIAAGFIGLMFIGTMFFRNNQPAVPANTVATGTEVKTDTVTPAQNNVIAHPQEKVIDKAQPQDAVAVVQANPRQPLHKTDADKTIPIDKRNPKAAQNETQIAEINTQNQGQTPIENPQSTIIPAVAHVDEQLAEAGHSSITPKAIKVDAAALLSQVDGELELSFREKVIKTASKNYKNVKVALANRNQK